MSQICRGAGSARTFVPVTCIRPRSSACVPMCPMQGLREAVVWTVLASPGGQQGHKLLQDSSVLAADSPHSLIPAGPHLSITAVLSLSNSTKCRGIISRR